MEANPNQHLTKESLNKAEIPLKEIISEINFIPTQEKLVDNDYQGNVTMHVRRQYEDGRTFQGEAIPEKLYNEAILIEQQVEKWQEEGYKHVCDIDKILLQLGEEHCSAATLVHALLQNILSEKEFEEAYSQLRIFNSTQVRKESWAKIMDRARQIYSEYSDFLKEALMRTDGHSLETLERELLASSRRAPLDHKNDEAIKKTSNMLKLIRERLSTFPELAERDNEREKKIYQFVQQFKTEHQLPEYPPQLFEQLLVADAAFGDLKELKGKKILDLGCGSLDNADAYEGDINMLGRRLFEPWFCRALFELGAIPVGIDVGDLKDEKFEHYQLDLSKIGVLDFLPNQSFDAINCRLLFDSPRLSQLHLPKSEIDAMRDEIEKQIKRLLKDSGQILSYTVRI